MRGVAVGSCNILDAHDDQIKVQFQTDMGAATMKGKMMPFGWKPQALKVTRLLKGQTEENQRQRFIVPQTVWWDRSTLHRCKKMLSSSTSKMFFSNCSFHFLSRV